MTQDLATLAEHKRLLEGLEQDRGFQLFIAYLTQAQEGLQAEVNSALTSAELVYLQEFKKGHLYCLKQIAGYREAFVSDIQSTINQLVREMEDQSEGESHESSIPSESGYRDGSGDGDSDFGASFDDPNADPDSR